MKYQVEITEPAQRDMVEIYLYISNTLKEPGVAKRLYFDMRKAILSLETFPGRHALIKEMNLQHTGIRKCQVKNYLIFYEIEEEKGLVTILRVLYARREWQDILSKN